MEEKEERREVESDVERRKTKEKKKKNSFGERGKFLSCFGGKFSQIFMLKSC